MSSDTRMEAQPTEARAERFIFNRQQPLIRIPPRPDSATRRLLSALGTVVPLPAEVPESDGEIDDLAADLPHLGVSMILTRLSNVVTGGAGVTSAWARWETSSGLADDQHPPAFVSLPLPGPGETWPVSAHARLYRGISLGRCGSASTFPIAHSCTVGEQQSAVGDFHVLSSFNAVDDSTLTTTGNFSFGYTVRAESNTGGASDFHFRGAVVVACTGRREADPGSRA